MIIMLRQSKIIENERKCKCDTN